MSENASSSRTHSSVWFHFILFEKEEKVWVSVYTVLCIKISLLIIFYAKFIN